MVPCPAGGSQRRSPEALRFGLAESWPPWSRPVPRSRRRLSPAHWRSLSDRTDEVVNDCHAFASCSRSRPRSRGDPTTRLAPKPAANVVSNRLSRQAFEPRFYCNLRIFLRSYALKTRDKPDIATCRDTAKRPVSLCTRRTRCREQNGSKSRAFCLASSAGVERTVCVAHLTQWRELRRPCSNRGVLIADERPTPPTAADATAGRAGRSVLSPAESHAPVHPADSRSARTPRSTSADHAVDPDITGTDRRRHGDGLR